MRITTRVTFDMETGALISRESYEYEGPLELCGGGKSAMRNLTQNQATTNAANAATDRATQLGATGKVQGVANQLMATKPGQLSPWSAANYASNADNIAKTYANQRALGFKALGGSGFGSSPGAIASVMNTAGQQAGAANTENYRNALQDTLGQTLQGANMEQGISGQYGGQSQNESAQAVNDAAQRIKEGSTFGDIMGGIGAVAPVALAPFTGGASLGFSGIARPGSSTSSAPGMQGPWSTGQFPTTGTYGFGNISRPSYANTGVGYY